jgi:hypothetical protein
MAYDAPGGADQLTPTLTTRWNAEVQRAFNALLPGLGTRFFSIDPDTLANPVPATVKWFGDPAEPGFCLGSASARTLSDWGVRGRHALHNEYCEYRTVHRTDSAGRSRPKRVQITTELREYWLCVAAADPARLRVMVAEILGVEPSWEDLYGEDPAGLSERDRVLAFSRVVAGHGNDRALSQAGVPAQPTGPLNTDNALFMTHPINGLDDLIYIVLFGAKPYARTGQDGREPATREQIFREFGVEHLACRHADPAAAMAAHAAAYDGRTVAFQNPLGMYILGFAENLFQFRGGPVPAEWIRWSRGQDGMHQRLVFGPGDEDDAFLDDITVSVGSSEEPVTGGFQVVQQMEVGPLVLAGEAGPVDDGEFVLLDQSDVPIVCRDAGVCEAIRRLKAEHDAAPIGMVRTGPRTMEPAEV